MKSRRWIERWATDYYTTHGVVEQDFFEKKKREESWALSAVASGDRDLRTLSDGGGN
jgi:hypothetical protein